MTQQLAAPARATPLAAMTQRLMSARFFWVALFAVTWALSTWSFDLYKAFKARWIIKYPSGWKLSLDKDISAFMAWLMEEASIGPIAFRDITRGISAIIEAPYDLARNLLIDGFAQGQGEAAVQIVPPFSWIAIIFAFVVMARFAGGWKLAALVGACFGYLAIFGQWESAMVTLASVLIAVPIGVAGGMALGILAYRHKLIEQVLRPILDLMQTVPVFAYLVPILILFGFGAVAALVATVIYAMPPMVRVTLVALRGVAPEVVEVGRMSGCTTRQMMWKVLAPSAAPTLMVGVNQVIMLTLNMVIIASMIGAGGLGYDVLTALRRLDIGGGIEAGLAIVVMAVALDRLSQAFATRSALEHHPREGGLLQRRPLLSAVLIVAVATSFLGAFIPAIQSYPEALTLTTGDFWSRGMEYINVNYFDTFEAVKGFFLTWLLLPVKRFFTGIPWAWGVIATALICWRVGGWRLALMGGLMMWFIAANGLWAKAMITIYLCGASVFIATLIGIPIGVLAAQNERAGRIVGALMDTLQTLPSFVYLIPVVMLFRVGDFTAMIAIILYALAPAVRYAAHGVRSAPPALIEAGKVSGCTRLQLLWRINLPLAAPHLLLGLNQTIMLALSMLVITALVGTRDLGQEVYIALTKANVGKGVIAGLAVAFLAITADRIVTALAASSKKRLGLSE